MALHLDFKAKPPRIQNMHTCAGFNLKMDTCRSSSTTTVCETAKTPSKAYPHVCRLLRCFVCCRKYTVRLDTNVKYVTVMYTYVRVHPYVYVCMCVCVCVYRIYSLGECKWVFVLICISGFLLLCL
jgi:hypothetical protein